MPESSRSQMRQPIALPPREELEIRLDRTVEAWHRWIGFHEYRGPWQEPVMRSLLALERLVHAPSGAVVAAPTS
jgi:GH15 family glucan-1,4-alpha-glucosidase